MTVLIDVRLLGTGEYSGVEEYTRHLVSALISAPGTPTSNVGGSVGAPHRFLLFTSGLRQVPLPPAWTCHPRVEVINWHFPNKIIDASFRFFNRPALAERYHADVVLSPHFSYLASGRVPLILTIHDLSFFHYPEFFSLRQRLWHFRSASLQARRAAHVIADSAFTKSDIISLLNIPAERVPIIFPGLSPEFKLLPADSPEVSSCLRRRGLSFPYLLFVGSFEPRKNVDGLIRAFSLIKKDSAARDLRLVLIGGKSWRDDAVTRALHASPHRDDIIIFKNIVPEERVLLYNGASVFVYPSFFEGFGFPPLEAQACGVPVVASDRTSLPEVLGNSALLVDPWEINKLADAVVSILSDKNVSRHLREKGIANAKRFSWPCTASQILNLISTLPH